MENSEQLDQIFKALSLAQAELKAVEKDAANPFFKSKYATLEAVMDTVREPITKQGLCLFHIIEGETLITVLGHLSGQKIVSRSPLLMAKKDSQSLGSAISYMRRYAVMALLGLASTDEEEEDDGERAMGRPAAKPFTPQPRPQSPPQPLKPKIEVISMEQVGEIVGLQAKAQVSDIDLSKVLEGRFNAKSLYELESKHFRNLVERLKKIIKDKGLDEGEGSDPGYKEQDQENISQWEQSPL